MKKKPYTLTTIINHSRDLIHMALSNQWNRFLEHGSENFVYIADYNALYTKDRDSFAKQIQAMACHIPDAAAEEAAIHRSAGQSIWNLRNCWKVKICSTFVYIILIYKQ